MKVFYLKKHFFLVLLVLTALGANAQTGALLGKVLDETGLPLPGASVQIKSLNKNTLTNADGTYKISGLSNGTVSLLISYVGYQSKQESVKINGNTVANFSLKPDAQSLNEVVVVGYGTQTRREVTGSISKVTGDKLTAIPTPSFEASLQGQAPGVQVTQGSGLAGSGSIIRIRGIGSISAGGDPLYVVDGIPITSDPFIGDNRGGMNQNPLATINPNDIESVEVLKDAGAAGIYGSRGANGVILITTKRGKLGKPVISLSSKYGFTTYANRPEFVSGPEWLQLRQEAWANDGNTGLATLPNGLSWEVAEQNNTDWWGLLTKTGHTNDQSVSYSQGTERIKAFVSANYSNNESFLKGNAYQRYGMRTNIDVKATSYFNASVNVAYDRGTNTRVNAAWGGGLGDAMSTALPIYPVFNADGTYFNKGANPVRNVDLLDWKSVTDRVIAGATLEFKPVKDLSIKAIANIDNMDVEENQFQPAALRDQTRGYANSWPVKIFNNTFTGTANYDLHLGEKSKISFLAGVETQLSYRNRYPGGIYGEADGPFNKDLKSYNDAVTLLGAGTLFYVARDEKDTFESLFARINYSFDNKYYLQVLARRDGSSKFGPDNKYGYFPAASASWYISEENFLKGNKVLSNLKLRTSYGLVGSSQFRSGQYAAFFNPGSIYNGTNSVYPDNIANPGLKWEEARNFDLGLDFGFFNNRISGEFAYYHKKTTGALLNGAISPSTGFLTGWVNVGTISNEGLELSLNTINIQSDSFKWVTRLNVSQNKNKVLDLGGFSPDAVSGGTNDTRIAIGYPLGVNFLVRYKGVDPADGLPIWLNKDGYETKTFSLDDRVITGQVLPDYVGGLTNTFTYKGFELNTMFTFAIGGNLYDGSAKRQLGVVTDWNMRTDIADRWQKPGDIARFPRLTLNTNTYPGLASEWQYNSTMFLYDATFVRLREVTLSYAVPVTFANKLRLNNLKMFASGMNLLTFSKYPGGDPEIARDFVNAQDRNMSPNVTYLTTPQQKSLTFGLSTSF
ncbi:SusC/RagA family TonB-linked outer membrane protein [Pedobacter nyackensis]|uniref:TonB-linked outer membrane protein, SusC/RagA family n=1 Tax=Pedobacter nyackensis TaxID=475255 RepID=A0A1W2B539_9SPHI|nr:TonB-dependent receptor [Pedobacter nyackensis]SMC68123.1 TonB-linked outer membrane protein, SusC/RagA family [Pedobacter nyackensis]